MTISADKTNLIFNHFLLTPKTFCRTVKTCVNNSITKETKCTYRKYLYFEDRNDHSTCFHLFFHHDETLQTLKYFIQNPVHSNDLLDKINGEILLSHLVCTACLVLQYMLFLPICSLQRNYALFTNCCLCLADHQFCLMIGGILWVLCIAIKRDFSTVGVITYAGAQKSCLHSMSFQLSII